MYFTASADGTSYTQQISVLVSTGDKYWRAVLTGIQSV